MRILVLTNMYPSKQKPYSGLFVLNQYNAICNVSGVDDRFDHFYMKRTFTGKIGSILKYFWFLFRFIFNSLVKKKYDILHVHYYYPNIILAALYKEIFNSNVKVIVTFHGGDYYNQKITKRYKKLANYIDFAIPVSHELYESIRTFYPGPSQIISAGISNVFSPPLKEKKNQYDLIYVGSFYPIKGFDILIEALNNVNISLKICVVGSGELEKLIDKMINTKVKLDYMGVISQNEITKLFHTSKFLINTSRNESFGLSMTEAMASGVPVIATQTDGSREQINHGINGYFLSSPSPGKIALELENILSVSDDTYINLSNNAINSSDKYRVTNVALEVLKVYREVLQND